MKTCSCNHDSPRRGGSSHPTGGILQVPYGASLLAMPYDRSLGPKGVLSRSRLAEIRNAISRHDMDLAVRLGLDAISAAPAPETYVIGSDPSAGKADNEFAGELYELLFPGSTGTGVPSALDFGPGDPPPKPQTQVRPEDRRVQVGDRKTTESGGTTRQVGFHRGQDFVDVVGPWVQQKVWVLAIGYGWDCETPTEVCFGYIREAFRVQVKVSDNAARGAGAGEPGRTFGGYSKAVAEKARRERKLPPLSEAMATDSNEYKVNLDDCGICKLWVLVAGEVTDKATVTARGGALPAHKTHVVAESEWAGLGCLPCKPKKDPDAIELKAEGRSTYWSIRYSWEICELCKWMREPTDPEPPMKEPTDPPPPPPRPTTSTSYPSDVGSHAKWRYAEGGTADPALDAWRQKFGQPAGSNPPGSVPRGTDPGTEFPKAGPTSPGGIHPEPPDPGRPPAPAWPPAPPPPSQPWGPGGGIPPGTKR